MPNTIAEIRERLAAAAPGPWTWDDDYERLLTPKYTVRGLLPNREDNELLAHAPTDIARLLALLDGIAPHLETAMSALGQIDARLTSDIYNHHHGPSELERIDEMKKGFAKARAALARLKEALCPEAARRCDGGGWGSHADDL